jgi:hypothetical protein
MRGTVDRHPLVGTAFLRAESNETVGQKADGGFNIKTF